MSNEEAKVKHSKRIYQKKNTVEKKVKLDMTNYYLEAKKTCRMDEVSFC